MAREYPQVRSKVTIVFMDGEFRELEISASPGIARYLAEEAGRSGTLVFMDGPKSTCFPLAMVREWSIEALPSETTDVAHEALPQEVIENEEEPTIPDSIQGATPDQTTDPVDDLHGERIPARTPRRKRKGAAERHGNSKPRKGYWRDQEDSE